MRTCPPQGTHCNGECVRALCFIFADFWDPYLHQAVPVFRSDVSTIAAVYSGIMSDSIPDVPISCATGNCTWPIVPTLGVCGACMNMQKRLQVSHCTPAQDFCNFTISGGLTLSKPPELMVWNETTPVFVAGAGSDYIFSQKDVVGEGEISTGISFNFIGQSYSEFTKANRGTYSPGNETSYTQANVLAYECGLWSCIQARSVNVSNGIVKDALLEHRNEVNLGPRTQFERIPPAHDDPSFIANNNTDWFNYFGDMSQVAHNLFGALSGSITISANWDVEYDWGRIPVDNIHSYKDGFGSAADCLHAAWTYADDIDAWWARLAKSMTNNVRMNGFVKDEEDDRFDGTAWSNIVQVRVNWLWLVFPGTLVVLSTIFLVATMVASWHSNLSPWKSFILPVLYSRLEDGLQDEWMQEYARENTLLHEVKDRWVGLDECEASWTFRHVAKDSKKVHEMRFAGDTSLDG